MSSPDVRGAELQRGPVIIKAWAPWCSSCRALAPLVEDAATATGVPLVDLRVDEHAELADELGVRSIPTLVGLRDGAEVGRLVGLQPARAIDSLFAATLDGTEPIVTGAPRSLVAARAAAGTALAAAGVAIDAIVLVALGAALIAWALSGLVRAGSRGGG